MKGSNEECCVQSRMYNFFSLIISHNSCVIHITILLGFYTFSGVVYFSEVAAVIKSIYIYMIAYITETVNALKQIITNGQTHMAMWAW